MQWSDKALNLGPQANEIYVHSQPLWTSESLPLFPLVAAQQMLRQFCGQEMQQNVATLSETLGAILQIETSFERQVV